MRVIACVCMLLGCFLGAGFVSGREIASYFSRFGNQSIWGIVSATILLFLLILFFLKLSDRTSSFEKFSKYYFGRFQNLASLLMALSVLIIISSMFAGTISLSETFNLSKLVFVGITIILAYFIVQGSLSSLSRVNIFLMPFLVVIVLIVTIMDFPQMSFDSDILISIASGGNYVFINIVTLGLFLLEIGYKYSSKEKFAIAIISSLVIGIMLLIINNAIIGKGVINETFPNLALASESKFFYVCMQLSIFFGLFTTLLSNVYIFSNYLCKYVHNLKLSIVITLILGLILSLFGFEIVVGYIYWLIGLIGVIMIAVVLFSKKKE